ncbi:hypothetical protein Tco_0305167 [Tanacetum coccineum]
MSRKIVVDGNAGQSQSSVLAMDVPSQGKSAFVDRDGTRGVQIWARPGFDGDRRLLRVDVGFPSRDENRLEQGSAHKSVIVGVSRDLRGILELVYHDLYLGGKAWVERRTWDSPSQVRLRAYGSEPSVNLGPAGNWLTLSNRTGPDIPRAVTKPITHIEEMDFRSFMMERVDGEFYFVPEGGVGDEEGSSPTIMSVNNETLEDEVILVGCDAADKAKNQKVPPQASKASGDPSDPLDVDNDPDILEFPSAKELKDSKDWHWVVAHVTPPLWKQHLKEIILEKLCSIHDKAYMWQVVLDNVMNRRTRELMSTLRKLGLLAMLFRKGKDRRIRHTLSHNGPTTS